MPQPRLAFGGATAATGLRRRHRPRRSSLMLRILLLAPASNQSKIAPIPSQPLGPSFLCCSAIVGLGDAAAVAGLRRHHRRRQTLSRLLPSGLPLSLFSYRCPTFAARHHRDWWLDVDASSATPCHQSEINRRSKIRAEGFDNGEVAAVGFRQRAEAQQPHVDPRLQVFPVKTLTCLVEGLVE